jgi:hypothetical protein
MPKTYCVCRECGSENVLHDAFVRWNKETQKFEVDNVFDKGAYCCDCDGETSIDWEEMETDTSA